MDRDVVGTGAEINHSPADSLQKQGEQAGRRDARGRFSPGRSGNPRGRLRGSRNRATLLAEALLDGQAEELVRRVIGSALEGDGQAQRLCLERIIAPRRNEHVRFALPALTSPGDAARALAAVAAAVARGDLAPAEAGDLAALVQEFVRAIEAHEFEARLVTLEVASAATGTSSHG
jgi:Family of unknown function (DUF5681)